MFSLPWKYMNTHPDDMGIGGADDSVIERYEVIELSEKMFEIEKILDGASSGELDHPLARKLMALFCPIGHIGPCTNDCPGYEECENPSIDGLGRRFK